MYIIKFKRSQIIKHTSSSSNSIYPLFIMMLSVVLSITNNYGYWLSLILKFSQNITLTDK